MTIPKFRAWDKITRQLLPVESILLKEKFVNVRLKQGFWVSRAFYEIELMQSTGLVDENGKEIFEGDIVKYKLDGGEDYIEIVAYDETCGAFGVKGVHGSVWSFDYLFSHWDVQNLEVIGNIYENQELLEEAK